MTLPHKIIGLLSFMALVTFAVLFWSYSRMSYQFNHFKEKQESAKQKILRRRDQSLKKLNEKAEKVGKDISSFLGGMEEALKREQKESDKFAEEFLKKQNGVFDSIEAFAGGK